MFNKNKKENQDNQLGNIIVEGTFIEGNIKSETNIRIDGKVQGNIDCESNLWVGETGKVVGDIRTQSCSIEGHIEGNITATETVSLKNSSTFIGDISAKNLMVDKGSAIKGKCNVNNIEEPNIIKSIKETGGIS